jgi:uncharacterized protein (DUF486 family)
MARGSLTQIRHAAIGATLGATLGAARASLENLPLCSLSREVVNPDLALFREARRSRNLPDNRLNHGQTIAGTIVAPPKSRAPMSTILLLMLSNVFMTFAWYGHLKYGHNWPLWQAIVVSWGIALLEYCLAVPANRLGYLQFSGFQLKIIQEVITISVFIVFAILFLKEKLAWNYLVAFTFLGVAAFFAFAFKTPGPVG